jgi:two-component system, OmpR family, copper resistance phosphate regulon response regulator CusR
MKILLIEDDKNVVNFIKAGLEAKMYIIDIALDGDRGLFLARTNKYQVIILDCNLPKLSGYKVLLGIRQEKITTPILVLSIQMTIEDKKKMFLSGADDYLTKPFIFTELLLRIKALEKRPSEMLSDRLSIANLILDQNYKSVKRNKRMIYLTKKEYNLLQYLMLNQGKILSRIDILENVWDVNADPFSNSLEAHVMSLRKKLNKGGEKNLIHTFNGRGYKMSEKKY